MNNISDFKSAAEIREYVDDQWPKIDSLGAKSGWSPDLSSGAIAHQNEYRFGVLRAALGAALLRIEDLESRLEN